MHDGLSIVIDKSTLQSLSSDEGFWLGAFFHVVLIPPLFMEIRADLLKASRNGREPEREVAILAEKLPGFAASVSLDHYTLCVHDLMGNPVELGGRPIIGGAQEFVSTDGRRGLFFDEQPEIKSLRNWREGIFTDEDWDFARTWREDLCQLNLNLVKKQLAWTRKYTKGLKTDEDVLAMVDKALEAHDYNYDTLRIVVGLLRVPKVLYAQIIEKWDRAGRPMVGIYAPYATHVFRVDMFFYSALARGLLSPDKPSDRIDMSYLYYLPFCQIFASSDKLHKRIAPRFLSGRRIFVDGDDLKADLAALRDYYDALPREKRRTDFPPVEGNFLVSGLYDALRPGWRERAKEPPIEITRERNEAIMRHLRPMLDAIDDLKKEG